jgi:hypothetical protein
MPTNDDRKITLDEMKEFLGAPPLIRGESEEAFWKWFTVFTDEHQPESFSDWLEVHDYAVKQWEKNRLQRFNSALIEGGAVSSAEKPCDAVFYSAKFRQPALWKPNRPRLLFRR